PEPHASLGRQANWCLLWPGQRRLSRGQHGAGYWHLVHPGGLPRPRSRPHFLLLWLLGPVGELRYRLLLELGHHPIGRYGSVGGGDADTIVAGGLNVLTNPDAFAGLGRGHFLSATGHCKTWDGGADGYCRADGVGSVVLKRLDDTEADNDIILGVILAAATN